MTALLIVRAEVPEPDHEAFDRWYEDEHLPEAHAAFGSLAARRGWSDTEPGVHVAVYEFPSLEKAREVVGSEAIRGLIAEFDRVWHGRVRRTREVVAIDQTL